MMSMCRRGPAAPPLVGLGPAGPPPDGLGEEPDADAHQLAARPALRLLGAQRVVAGQVQRLAQRGRVVARVVDPAGLGLVGELLGRQQVGQAQLHGVHLQLEGQAVDEALDRVDGLGDAERARVRDAAGRLVRVHACDLAVRRLEVVGAGEHVEEPGRVLGRLGGRVERAVVGDHVDVDREDPAVSGRGDAALHHVVAREPGRHQVLRAVLHPLDRPAGDDRADDRAHVAWVHRDLVAEAAADVRGDDTDLVLGQSGHQRVYRPVGVRRLGRAPQGQLARHVVEVGDRAAGLHRRRVRARVQHVLLDHHVGAGEHLLGRRPVA
jgi:hypothetical protein